MSAAIGTALSVDRWQSVLVNRHAVPSSTCVCREPTSAPLRKLSVGLIQTYKHINEVTCSLIYYLHCHVGLPKSKT